MAEESSDAAGHSGWPVLALRHNQFLLEHIDPDFGLLRKLVSKRILSVKQRDVVKTGATVDERNIKLLDIVRSEDKWDGLIDALKSSNQTHVVNYLAADGIPENYSGFDWPLSDREENLINDNLEQLNDLIEVSELVTKVLGMNVINKSQRDFIRAKQTSSERNEAFIDILRRRSIRDYKKVVYCLKETNQPHIAQLLENGGAIVGLHVNTDGITEAERELASKITEMIVSRPFEERGRILECINLNVIAATTAHSVVLYVYLQTPEQLNQLKELLQSELIKYQIQELFNRIASSAKPIAVSNVIVTNGELNRVENILKANYSYMYESKTTKRSDTADKQDKESEIISSTLVQSQPLQGGFQLKEPMMRLKQTNRRSFNVKTSFTRLIETFRKGSVIVDVGSSSESPLRDTSTHTASGCGVMDDTIYGIAVQTLARHKRILEEIIDCDSGLLDILLSKGALAPTKIRFIKWKQTHEKRNAKLLEYIMDLGKCDSFVDSLRETRQTHVANYLIGDGEFRPEFGDFWPLSNYQRHILKINEEALASLIEIHDELSNRLHDTKAINQRQRDILSSKGSTKKKVRDFLQMLRRMCQIDFRHVMKCLVETNQSLVARALDERGVIVKILVDTEATNETKQDISNEFGLIQFTSSATEFYLIYQLKYLYVIGIKNGRRINVYVSCRTISELEFLQSHMKSGKLKDSVEELLTKIASLWDEVVSKRSASSCIKVKGISIKEYNEDEARNFLQLKTKEIEKNNDEKDGSQTITQGTINQLPLEIMDLILQKAYIGLAQQGNPKLYPGHLVISTRLASVNICWFQRLIKRKFKLCVRRKLLEFYRNQRQIHHIIRDNSHYFESSAQFSMSNLIGNMKFNDCITDVQAASIQRQKHGLLKDNFEKPYSNKACDLFEIVKSLDESRYSSFIRCLRQTGYQNISRMIANGGAVIPLRCLAKTKARSKSGDEVEKVHTEKKAVESQAAKQLEKKLFELDVEIVETCLDRGSVCWIWCESVKDFKNLQESDASKRIFKDIVETIGATFKTSVDSESFEKTMAIRSEVASDSPLTDIQLQILNANHETLVDRIDLNHLLSNLVARNVINQWQEELITSKQNFAEKNEAFLKILRRLSKEDFSRTIVCLYESKQNSAAQILGEGVAVNVATLIWRKSYLAQVIDPDSGLLDELLLKETLSSTEIRSINEEQTYVERNDKLLKHIISKQQCASFVDSLQSSGQSHVVNYLTFDEIGYVISDNWPLTKFSLSKLSSFEDELLELIEMKDIEVNLYATGLINRKHKEVIDSKETSTEKKKAFIEILRRMSLKAFRQTIKCLYASNQVDAAQILEKTEKRAYISVATLDRHKSYLDQIIDPDSGLLDDLLLKETLSSEEALAVNGERTYVKRNAKLLDCITSKEKCDSLVDSLQFSGQTHVVNYLASNGKFADEDSDDWPLTKASLDELSNSEKKLLKLIDVREITEKFCARGLLNRKQKLNIDSKQTSTEKKKAFLEILRRMSQKAFMHAIECLRDLEQWELNEILFQVQDTNLLVMLREDSD